jgi:hypothetical protein
MQHPLKKAIQDKGLLIKFVAKQINASYHALIMGLNGKMPMSNQRVKAICSVIGEDYTIYINTNKECA